ncbi:hypothetical protein KAFR_0G03140 [Kazachstania africana CBS 2517]|uniref:Nodulin-like domain-containing protein n=1 Tax=Kazachstania africana (strain ATCC 22294 / BCRC 22015 / CBS 2517 / CECT 1963 / NBRC 1671 / NRRL Y-8276) TaxID=1071382 RepID=H2AY96_KAZAF|nr:hypothetical protein KAFR_0G03140 [Kazachstania africana CBS 2517]CCF59346.1 hypothetical protein KAFR_0G03140 [Kazachstania africana CBS 2517]
MALSSIERRLSYHVRHLLPKLLSTKSSHFLAYILSLLSLLTAGFITIISLYAHSWQSVLHYSSWQINIIASTTNLGLYLTPPILGIIADSHGPITLSCLSVLGFVPSYSYISHVFHSRNDSTFAFHASLASFFCIGVSTSCLYFSALLTCTKLYPSKKLLSVSLPTTAFGVSSFLGSQLIKVPWFWTSNSDSTRYLNLARIFRFFAILYIIVGLLAWIATGVVSLLTHIESDYIQHHQEADPLLQDSSVSISSISVSSKTSDTNDTKETNSSLHLFKNPVLLILLVSMIFSLGPLEMFAVDMSTISTILVPSQATPTTTLLPVYALSSVVSRLLTGVIMDFQTRRGYRQKHILFLYLACSLFLHLLLFIVTSTDSSISIYFLYFIGSMFGIVNGGLYTIYPILTLIIYKNRHFGKIFGFLMISPAVGTLLSCLQFAKTFDSNCANDGSSICIKSVYEIGLLQNICAFGLSWLVYNYWSKRNSQI